MHRNTIIICLLLFIRSSLFGQSVYQLEYNFHSPADSATYSALLFRNEDGSGLMQLKHKYASSSPQQLTIADTYYEGEAANGKNPVLIIQLSVPAEGSVFTSPVILFMAHKKTGLYEPAGVCLSASSPVMAPGTLFSFKYLAEKEQTRQLGLQYFNATDPFFKNFFRSKSRGSFTLQPSEKDIKMHLIIAADVKDSSIGYSCMKDMKKALETFDSIRKYMGIPKKNFISKIFYGPSYSIKNVKQSIQALKPAPNDIVIFYYSGHGFRVNETDSFPYIKLKTFHTTTKDVMDNSIRIKEDVFDVIRKKGARFNLVVSDCCNSSIEESTKAPGPKPPGSRGDDDWDLIEPNTRELFLNKTPSSILISAAKNGEKARCHLKYNGFFSHSFFSSLKQFTTKGKSNVSWEQLFDNAKVGTHKLAQMSCCSDPCCDSKCVNRVRCTQTAIYSVIYGR